MIAARSDQCTCAAEWCESRLSPRSWQRCLAAVVTDLALFLLGLKPEIAVFWGNAKLGRRTRGRKVLNMTRNVRTSSGSRSRPSGSSSPTTAWCFSGSVRASSGDFAIEDQEVYTTAKDHRYVLDESLVCFILYGMWVSPDIDTAVTLEDRDFIDVERKLMAVLAQTSMALVGHGSRDSDCWRSRLMVLRAAGLHWHS